MGGVLVTGAAGFIGSHLVRALRKRWPERPLISYDKLTYSGRKENLESFFQDPHHVFVQGDTCDGDALAKVFARYGIDAVLHLAAETHVDRSVLYPDSFMQTNVAGTLALLRAAQASWEGSASKVFVHVSTDEVFGSLGAEELFTERSPYAPRSPYAASKAASDHFVRAWHETHGLPTVVAHPSNTYGPRQFPEKLLPLVIKRALRAETIPIYGNGKNVRDWLFVEDLAEALVLLVEAGEPGRSYCIGARCERNNLQVVDSLLQALGKRLSREDTLKKLIAFVKDRPGHDQRYASDPTLLETRLGWRARSSLDVGLEKTVDWYLAHQDWLFASETAESKEFETSWYANQRAGD